MDAETRNAIAILRVENTQTLHCLVQVYPILADLAKHVPYDERADLFAKMDVLMERIEAALEIMEKPIP